MWEDQLFEEVDCLVAYEVEDDRGRIWHIIPDYQGMYDVIYRYPSSIWRDLKSTDDPIGFIQKYGNITRMYRHIHKVERCDNPSV